MRMQIASPASAAAAVSPPHSPVATSDPNQPPLPGLEPDVIARMARYAGDKVDAPVKLLRDRPVDAPAFAAFDEAVTAANEIMVRERRDARWGLFRRHPGKVLALALVEAKEGIRLVRSNVAIDRFKEPVPGQMFPGQNWWGMTPTRMVREQPSTLALVGGETMFDLRSGRVEEPKALGA